MEGSSENCKKELECPPKHSGEPCWLQGTRGDTSSPGMGVMAGIEPSDKAISGSRKLSEAKWEIDSEEEKNVILIQEIEEKHTAFHSE